MIHSSTTAAGSGPAASADAKPARAASEGEPRAGGPRAEEPAGASFALLFAWLAGAVPPAPSPGGGGAPQPSTGSPAATAPPEQGQGLPRHGNNLPLLPPAPLPPAPLPPPAQQSAASDGAAGGAHLGESRSELLSAALKPLRDAALAALGEDGEVAAPRDAAPAVDLSFLSGAGRPEASRAAVRPHGAGAAAPPPGQLELDQALGQRVAFMVEHGVHDARVRVHPEHLGPIDIRLKVDGDAAQVTFHSPHGLVRDALTDAVPRLRDMLSDSGLTLLHVDVDAGGAFDPRGSGERASPEGGAEAPPELGEPVADPAAERDAPRGIRVALVDTFA